MKKGSVSKELGSKELDNAQITIADLKKLIQQSFDHGRAFAADCIAKNTCTEYGEKVAQNLLAKALAPRGSESSSGGEGEESSGLKKKGKR